MTIALEYARADVEIAADDTVASMELILDALRFEDVERALIAKYGSPSDTEISANQNRRGKPFDQRKLTWVGEKAHIKVVKYFIGFLGAGGDIVTFVSWCSTLSCLRFMPASRMSQCHHRYLEIR